MVGTDKVVGRELVQADITKFDQIKRVVQRTNPDAVVHLAAISGSTGKNEIEQSLRQAQLNFEVNCLGTVNICEACKVLDIKRMIYMSSFAVYGRTDPDRLPIAPETPVSLRHAYANSKYMGELAVRTYCEDFGMKSVVFRSPFVAGENQNERNVLLEFIQAARNESDLVILGQGTHVREFLHPIDLVAAFNKALILLERPIVPCETFTVGNTPISMNELAELVVSKVGKGHIKHVSQTEGRNFNQYSEFSKATRLLQWAPRITVSEIVERILNSGPRKSG